VYIFELVLYNLFMSTMSVTEARENFSEAIATSAVEAVFIQKHGENAAVLISPERYEELMDALEEIEDMAAYDAAMADPSPNIPWEEVKRQLGLA
jgi:antitoxin Phd